MQQELIFFLIYINKIKKNAKYMLQNKPTSKQIPYLCVVKHKTKEYKLLEKVKRKIV